ncbi:MAG: C10 family peptidase, partial [Bacteroidota bacterium]|nr:C10 family peptidase [Bacteroidota bacterium]
MKYFYTIILVSLISFGHIFGKEIQKGKAQKVAANFYNQKTGVHLNLKSGDSEILLSYIGVSALDTVFYAYSVKNNNGFVLVSADDAVNPVLAYSTKGAFTGENIPPATQYILDEFSEQIIFAKRNNLQATENISLEWSKLLSNNIHKVTVLPPVPLLLTNWSQGSPYNEFCPEDPAGPAGHALVGCVAISMAQVMKYYNFPAQGTGSSSYYASGYGSQSVNYGNTNYEFYNMPNVGTESNASLAEFLYHCGVSAKMNYGPDGSGAW